MWTLVHEQLSGGHMPPEERARPADGDGQNVLAWIEQQQRALRGGGTRRLNRRELAPALRDVTGLSVDYAAALPDDGRVDGFDTGAEGLQDAADSVAQVMQVTRRAVDAIRFLEPDAVEPVAIDLVAAKGEREAFDEPRKRGALADAGGEAFYQQGTGMLLRPVWLGDRGGFHLKVNPPPGGRLGVLRLKVVVSVKKFMAGLPNPHLWVEVGDRELEITEVTNPPEQPRTLTYEAQLNDLPTDKGAYEVTLRNRVEVPYAVPGFENEVNANPEERAKIPGGSTGLWRPRFEHKLPPEQWPVPFVVVHSVEIDPDYRAAWPLAGWKADVGQVGDNPDSVKRLLKLWADRAWRRPAGDDELARFFGLYEKLRGQGLSFDDALRPAFQSVLLSGSFRYLPSPVDVDTDAAQHATASRLSFMLWGAPPDSELRDLATAGKLRDPAVLDAQVDRLLADPRSDGFVRPFVTQWLVLDQPITVAMDHIRKEDYRFGRNLKASMREETITYVGRLFAENRPAREFFSSDWTLMNEILARHYGYAGVEGGHLREMKLRPDDPRGGVLGHAGVQSMLTWMGENWVIYRGAWALRNVLDDPPPPPPLEVPELVPSDGKNQGKPFRELLKLHMADSRCSVCHEKMDPLGFAFQNFDLSGRWRDVEFERYKKGELDGKIEWRGEGNTRPVDAEGALPRGESFKTFAECKQLLAANYTRDLARGLAKRLVLYGTGCKPDVAAMAEVDAILAELGPKGYPLRDLLKAVVRSRTFVENQFKRPEVKEEPL